MDEGRNHWPLAQGMHEHYPEQQPSPVNLMEYVRIAQRRRWSFMIPLLIVLMIAVAVALLMPAIYRSEATILIEEQEIPTTFVSATVTSFAEQRLQQINQRIMSTTRLLEIIEQFDLYKKMRKKRTSEEVVEQMRNDVKLRQISAEVVNRRTGQPMTATIAFTLSYQGEDSPATIQKVANVLASLFLEGNLEVRERQTSETSKFLEDEMHRVQGELAEVEKGLADFKGLHINELPDLLQLNIQQLSSIENGMERLEEQLRGFKTQEGYLQTQLANLSPFMENTDRSQLRTMETELAKMRSRLSDEHPDVIRTMAAIQALKDKMVKNGTGKKIDREEPDNPAYITLSSQLAGIKTDIVSVRNQIEELKRTKAKYETRIENTPKVEREYRTIVTQQINLRAKSDDLMQKLMEAKVAHGLEKEQKGERFTMIDPPRLPEKPFKPNRRAIALIGLVLGIGAGIGIAALSEFSDASVYNIEKLAISSGFPVLGEVPAIMHSDDLRRIRTRRIIVIVAICMVIIGAVLAFHFWVMDLYVFWAKVDRRLGF